MATARPKQARRAGAAARTPVRAARPAPRPEKRSATRHRHELAAIACVALAVFLAFVIYLGWDGGALGRWLGGVTRWLVGLLVFVAARCCSALSPTCWWPATNAARAAASAGASR